MNRKQRYQFVFEYFARTQPNVTTELHFGSPWQLLVAVVLSAQCTDKRVNQVTPELFRLLPDALQMSQSDEEKVYSLIKSVSYPHAKASHLTAMAKMITERYNGELPDTMEGLMSLPGVGRKTANVILSILFGKPTIAVDTHVFRVSHRLGLAGAKDKTPEQTERTLLRNTPEQYLANAHHWLLLHGRYVCTSRNPHCAECPFCGICPANKRTGIAHAVPSVTK